MSKHKNKLYAGNELFNFEDITKNTILLISNDDQ